MGFFDSLFDKREKIDYCRGCDFLFQMVQMQKVQYTSEFSDMTDDDYRAELIGIVTAYLDTKPKEKRIQVGSTFGKDVIYYGTVHVPIEFKKVYLPKYQKRHQHYDSFIRIDMNNKVNATNTRLLALEICRLNKIRSDAAKVNAIVVDINVMLEIVNATLSTYRFV